jgi:hypothetical protein
MALVKESLVRPRYEYIEVSSVSWKNFFGREKYGFKVTGAYTETIECKEREDLFNRLGNKGWELTNVIYDVSHRQSGGGLSGHELVESDIYSRVNDYAYEDSRNILYKRDIRVTKTGCQEIPVPTFQYPNLYLECEKHYIFQRKILNKTEKNLDFIFEKLLNHAQSTKINSETGEEVPEKIKLEEDFYIPENPMELPIEELGLSNNTESALKDAGLYLVGDLVNTIKSLKDLRDLGIVDGEVQRIKSIFINYFDIDLPRRIRVSTDE